MVTRLEPGGGGEGSRRGVDGGVSGGLFHGVSSSGEGAADTVSGVRSSSVKLRTKGERGACTRLAAGLAIATSSMVCSGGSALVLARGTSGMTNVAGVGERSAKGSSSSKSEGGEFRMELFVLFALFLDLNENSEAAGLMGIAGGRTKWDVDAAADWERCRRACIVVVVGEATGDVALSAG